MSAVTGDAVALGEAVAEASIAKQMEIQLELVDSQVEKKEAGKLSV